MSRWSTVVGFVLIAASPAWGQSVPSISAQAGTNEADVGEAIPLQVTVSDPPQPVQPTAPETQDFEIRLASPVPGKNTQINQVFGGPVTQHTDYTYRYEIKPKRKGVLTLPPFTMQVNGVTYQSNPVRVRVAAGSGGPFVICEVTASEKEVYLGQSVNLTLEVWIRKFNQGGFALNSDLMWRIWTQMSANDSSLGVFSQADLDRLPNRSARRNDDDGVSQDYFVYTIATAVTPSQEGTFDFGRIEFAYNYPIRISRDVFGRINLDRSKRLRESPELPKLTVHSVPIAGRPADYNGAVGRFTIDAAAKPTTVAVGDPITLTFTIRGGGSLDSLSAPRLDRVESLTRDFEVPTESLAGTMTATGKSFTQTIRPLREDVKAIPPIPMSYFDPQRGAFETARSRAIPIKVVPAERASPRLAGGADPGRSPELVETTEGLLANYADADAALVDQTVHVGPVTAGVLIGLPILYAGTVMTQRRSARFRNDQALRRRSRAYSTARRILRANGRSSSPDAVAGALLGYIADRCNVPSAGMTRPEAVRLLDQRKVDPERIRAVDDLLNELEQARYGGTGVNGDRGFATTARRVIDELEDVKIR